jgi:hypothetical protein
MEKKEKFYIEIKPDSEIVRVGDGEDLKSLNELNEVKELPVNQYPQLPNNDLPELRKDEVCAHWERELVFLSSIDFKLSKQLGDDYIVGGICKDCGKKLGMPKKDWYPKVSYK